VRDVEPQVLFEHSRRVFLWGALRAATRGLEHDAELFYVASLFHDIGLVEGHRSPDERFEVDGANAARAFLERHGLPEEQVRTVWESIALHTTPGIPRYMRPEVWMVNLGAEYDVVGRGFEELSGEQRGAVLAAFPRTGFKQGIVELFSEGMRDKPQTAYGTMNADILEATLPGYVRPNYCDLIRNAPFDG
jgi:hypothetical protein